MSNIPQMAGDMSMPTCSGPPAVTLPLTCSGNGGQNDLLQHSKFPLSSLHDERMSLSNSLSNNFLDGSCGSLCETANIPQQSGPLHISGGLLSSSFHTWHPHHAPGFPMTGDLSATPEIDTTNMRLPTCTGPMLTCSGPPFMCAQTNFLQHSSTCGNHPCHDFWCPHHPAPRLPQTNFLQHNSNFTLSSSLVHHAPGFPMTGDLSTTPEIDPRNMSMLTCSEPPGMHAQTDFLSNANLTETNEGARGCEEWTAPKGDDVVSDPPSGAPALSRPKDTVDGPAIATDEHKPMGSVKVRLPSGACDVSLLVASH